MLRLAIKKEEGKRNLARSANCGGDVGRSEADGGCSFAEEKPIKYLKAQMVPRRLHGSGVGV
jgi:hypothetical protein